MNVTPLGGGGEVGASCIHIDISGKRLLVDAGIRMGQGRSDALPDLGRLPGLGGIDAVLVTHAHMDHIGALPLVHEAYPESPIYATPATVRLMVVLLADALRIMQSKAEEEAEIPLYDLDLVQSMFRRVMPVDFGNAAGIGNDGIEVRFHPSGHILGASCTHICSPEGSLAVSGDLSLATQRTVPGMPIPAFNADVLVLESTYGDRTHSDRREEETKLAESVRRTIKGGGKVLIPAFALGRAQEVILILQAYQATGFIPLCPVWVDGMVRSVCEVYNGFPELLVAGLRNRIRNEGNPFYYRRGATKAVSTSRRRSAILDSDEPCIVVASSGMLSGGASPIYFKAFAQDPSNAVILTGYQDEESPGGNLMRLIGKGGGEFIVDGDAIDVKCRVEQVGLSAHADARELARLAESTTADHVILVHGDGEARRSLAERLDGSGIHVHLPSNGDTVSVDRGRSKAAQEGVPACEPSDRFTSLEGLWKCLADHGLPESCTFPELAAIWSGKAHDPTATAELEKALSESNPFFERDWKNPMLFKPRPAEKLRRILESRTLMGKMDLKGTLVLARNSSRKVFLAICFQTLPDGFRAWKIGTPSTHHKAEELLEILGSWPLTESSSGAAEKERLRRLESEVRSIYKGLKPEMLLTALSDGWSTPAQAAAMLGLDFDDYKIRTAVAWRLNAHHDMVERGSVDYGKGIYRLKARDSHGGGDMDVGVADADGSAGRSVRRMEQNQAMDLAERLMPGAIYKQGVMKEIGALKLYFDFPDADAVRFSGEMAELETATGWKIIVNGNPNMNALKEAARSVLSEKARFIGEPSIHGGMKKVVVKSVWLPTPEDMENARRSFKLRTGWDLEVQSR